MKPFGIPQYLNLISLEVGDTEAFFKLLLAWFLFLGKCTMNNHQKNWGYISSWLYLVLPGDF